MSVAHTGYNGYGGYGLHWWSKTFSIAGQAIQGVHAVGLAGQAVMVFPSLDLVVVVTSGNYNRSELEHALVSNFVLPAAGRFGSLAKLGLGVCLWPTQAAEDLQSFAIFAD